MSEPIEEEILAEAYFVMDKEMLRLNVVSGKENTDPTSTSSTEPKVMVPDNDHGLSDLVQEGSSAAAIGKIKTLKDYLEGKPKKSPRGVDLELIKASPREEDLTRIKFARFVFDGVKTSVVSRTVKHIEGSEKLSEVKTILNSAIESEQSKDEGRKQSPEIEDISEIPTSIDAIADINESFAPLGSQAERGILPSAALPASSRRPNSGDSSGGSSADIERLRKLSKLCIEQVGLHAVGQEYTRALKTVCKTLDVALRAGIG